MTFSGWFSGQEQVPRGSTDPLCLALQWKMSPTAMLPSNLYWTHQRCAGMAGYVCKKSRNDNVLIQNQTITGIEGRLTSPNYPNQYASNINYWVKIIAPEKSRIVVQFQKLDIEQQQECLYDYVSIQDTGFYKEFQSELKGLINGGMGADDYDADLPFKDEKKAKRTKVEIKGISINETSPTFQPYIRLCGAHEGDMSKYDFVSKSNEILVNFFTDYSTASEGFSAVWRSIDISACPSQTFTSREGVLTSPNFPHFLLHNLNCSYTIQTPIGRKIWIEFDAFDLAYDAEVHLDLGDGILLQPFKSAENIGDGVFSSRSEKVKIILKTGPGPRGQGFKVTFRTGKPQFIIHAELICPQILNISLSRHSAAKRREPHSQSSEHNDWKSLPFELPSGDAKLYQFYTTSRCSTGIRNIC